MTLQDPRFIKEISIPFPEPDQTYGLHLSSPTLLSVHPLELPTPEFYQKTLSLNPIQFNESPTYDWHPVQNHPQLFCISERLFHTLQSSIQGHCYSTEHPSYYLLQIIPHDFTQTPLCSSVLLFQMDQRPCSLFSTPAFEQLCHQHLFSGLQFQWTRNAQALMSFFFPAPMESLSISPSRPLRPFA